MGLASKLFVYRCDGNLILLAICILLHVSRGHPPVGPRIGEALHRVFGSGHLFGTRGQERTL